ncbi:DNA replication complex subunit Gins51 [Natranaeroarchaeum sulfidigenes]|uniref:DNA replication initiation complex subunit, GINS15 family n=1 Tax=Natranaeroarchaeum sulfidigenes TaxID=2784880 RepID=A0A897MQB4_9EURY|nr:hypothetical protein [Natranaeroarchaeum sulfidigenes]QSG02737.1 DNA replication initiation complex subunit, GINS15 family [Natranaeroarchaeum sulfidigenes]
MNLDDLRSVQSKERQKDSLQHLRDSFYEDVGNYIANLKNERERAAERADDPFSSTEVSQLTDEIETAEEVVEAVYERRMGKIVKRASLAAAGMPADEEGLTSEESELFGDLVDRIERNKDHVLDILAGETNPVSDEGEDTEATGGRPQDHGADQPSGEPTPDRAESADDAPPAPPDRPPEVPPEDVETVNNTDIDAADLMGGEASDGSDPPVKASRDGTTRQEDPAPGGDPPGDDAGRAPEIPPEGGTPTNGAEASPATDDTDRTTVRITEEIGEIFGVDDREYELDAEDVVTLPTVNAEPLVEQDAAQRID